MFCSYKFLCLSHCYREQHFWGKLAVLVENKVVEHITIVGTVQNYQRKFAHLPILYIVCCVLRVIVYFSSRHSVEINICRKDTRRAFQVGTFSDQGDSSKAETVGVAGFAHSSFKSRPYQRVACNIPIFIMTGWTVLVGNWHCKSL